MVSSAVYRYFPSRDALLTALIVEAYDAMGGAAERAERQVPRGDALGRVRAIAHAMRTWALANPNEYALIFGSPVPGYVAPDITIGPASRIPVLLIDVLRDHPGGEVDPVPLPPRVERAIEPLRSQLAPDLDPTRLALGYTLWEFILGAISIEVFGHQVNVIDARAQMRRSFFDEQVTRVAALTFGSV